MANRGWAAPDPTGRLDVSHGDHDTCRKSYRDDAGYCNVVGLTSVSEQISKGGWTRSEMPYSEDPLNLKPSIYQGGGAGNDKPDDGKYVPAAYPGRLVPNAGQTY